MKLAVVLCLLAGAVCFSQCAPDNFKAANQRASFQKRDLNDDVELFEDAVENFQDIFRSLQRQFTIGSAVVNGVLEDGDDDADDLFDDKKKRSLNGDALASFSSVMQPFVQCNVDEGSEEESSVDEKRDGFYACNYYINYCSYYAVFYLGFYLDLNYALHMFYGCVQYYGCDAALVYYYY